MTTTAIATRMIGKCFVCKRPYAADSAEAAAQMSCSCRAAVACPASHIPGDEGHTHPVTAIKWAAIKATFGAKKCGSACTGAKSDTCICECGGHRHGTGWI